MDLAIFMMDLANRDVIPRRTAESTNIFDL
jgi:hypothetical protein